MLGPSLNVGRTLALFHISRKEGVVKLLLKASVKVYKLLFLSSSWSICHFGINIVLNSLLGRLWSELSKSLVLTHTHSFPITIWNALALSLSSTIRWFSTYIRGNVEPFVWPNVCLNMLHHPFVLILWTIVSPEYLFFTY